MSRTFSTFSRFFIEDRYLQLFPRRPLSSFLSAIRLCDPTWLSSSDFFLPSSPVIPFSSAFFALSPAFHSCYSFLPCFSAPVCCLPLLLFLSSPLFSLCLLPSTPVIPFSPAFQRLSASLIAQFTELFSFFSITSVNLQRIFLLCQPHCAHCGRVACIGWPFHAKFAKKFTELLPIITISSVNFSYVIRFSYQIRVT